MRLRQVVKLLQRIRRFFQIATTRTREMPSPPRNLAEYDDEEDDNDDKGDHSAFQKRGYTLEEKLGEGSFSVVMSAYSEQHERHVAVKIVKRQEVPKLYVEKFLPREIELIRNISHENVVGFLSVTQTRTFIYVIMEIATQGNLLETIKKNIYIDEKRACRWFHHLVDGIAFCHGKGIAHRDLKCENVLLDKQNVLKITDFSFARANLPQYIIDNKENLDRNITLSSTFCGSYAYACPEILLRKPYEPHLSDTWSMGVILYAMLSGRLPFDDTNLHTLLLDVRRPVRFYKHPSLSIQVRKLILQILSPSRIRIYIPRIREDTWYIEMFQEEEGDEISQSNNSSCTTYSV